MKKEVGRQEEINSEAVGDFLIRKFFAGSRLTISGIDQDKEGKQLLVALNPEA